MLGRRVGRAPPLLFPCILCLPQPLHLLQPPPPSLPRTFVPHLLLLSAATNSLPTRKHLIVVPQLPSAALHPPVATSPTHSPIASSPHLPVAASPPPPLVTAASFSPRPLVPRLFLLIDAATNSFPTQQRPSNFPQQRRISPSPPPQCIRSPPPLPICPSLPPHLHLPQLPPPSLPRTLMSRLLFFLGATNNSISHRPSNQWHNA